MLFRVLMVTLLLGSAIVVNINDVESFADPSYIALFTLIIATYLATIGYAVFITRVQNMRLMGYIQLVGDVMLASGLVFVTGGTRSVFAFMFYLTIINSAILMGRRAALVTATLCSVSFLVMLLIQLGLFPLPRATEAVATYTSAAPVYSVVVNIVAYHLVGFLAGYLAQRLEEQDTELERKQLDIRELQALNQHILSSIKSGVLTLDRARRVLFLNRAAEELLGRHIDALYGRDACEVLPELSDAINALTHPASSARPPGVERIPWDGWVRREGHDAMFISVALSPLFDGQGGHYGHILTVQDQTQIHNMQRRVQRQDRLAAIGQLSAAIAHEIRNPLASISGSVEMLQMFVQASHDEERLMQIVLREIDRLNVLIGDFLDYTRDRRRSLDEVALDELIAEVVELFSHDEELTAEVELTHKLAVCRGHRVLANRDGIKQVFWNLLRNAAQAMDGRGKIVVTAQALAGELQSDGSWDNLSLMEDAAEAQVFRFMVTDTGPGIPDDVRAHLFEPFFTTKRGGTGLGLATIYRIVEDHDGNVGVETSEAGTSFIIDLPIRRTVDDLAVDLHIHAPVGMQDSSSLLLASGRGAAPAEVVEGVLSEEVSSAGFADEVSGAEVGEQGWIGSNDDPSKEAFSWK